MERNSKWNRNAKCQFMCLHVIFVWCFVFAFCALLRSRHCAVYRHFVFSFFRSSDLRCDVLANKCTQYYWICVSFGSRAFTNHRLRPWFEFQASDNFFFSSLFCGTSFASFVDDLQHDHNFQSFFSILFSYFFINYISVRLFSIARVINFEVQIAVNIWMLYFIVISIILAQIQRQNNNRIELFIRCS